MSKKFNLIVIIIFLTIFISGVFYKIDKSNQNKSICKALNKNNSKQVTCVLDKNNNKNTTVIFEDKDNLKDDESSFNYKYVTWNLQSLFKSEDEWQNELSKAIEFAVARFVGG